jgi:hypothetical protein
MEISEKKLKRLSERERYYLDLMMSRNTPYLRGRPGTAKSAIGVSIARKIEIRYIDKRLSQIDETDIGLYPVLNDAYDKLKKLRELMDLEFLSSEEFEVLKTPLIETIKSGQVEILKFAVPDWAFSANLEPTLIHIEELNRANVHVRNAALQLLNERQIGDLKLNDNVLLMCSGNIGEADGTEVDEMDLALSNRLVIIDHDLPYDEWIEQYARYNVCPLIVNYIIANPSEYYKLPNENEIRYATARSWTNMSKFMIHVLGKDPKPSETINLLMKFSVGKGFIGNSITGFMRYCKEMSDVSIEDILNKWDSLKGKVKDFNRARISELISNLKYKDIGKLSDNQVGNIIKFLASLQGNSCDDELTSYLVHVLDKTNESNFEAHTPIVRAFEDKCKYLMEHSSKNMKMENLF